MPRSFWQNIGYVRITEFRNTSLKLGARVIYNGAEVYVIQCEDRQVFQVFTEYSPVDLRAMLSITNSTTQLRQVLRGYNVPEKRIRQIFASAREA